MDAKGRLAIPMRYRQPLLDGDRGQLVVTLSPSGDCLWLYALSHWQTVEEQLSSLPNASPDARRLQRALIGCAADLGLDGQGRILLPPPLRKQAALGQRLMLVGQLNKFEIWDAGRWEQELDQMSAMSAADLPALGQLAL